MPLLDRHARQSLWEESLDEAAALLGPEQLWKAWDALGQMLGRSWRGSMLAECVNRRAYPRIGPFVHFECEPVLLLLSLC